MEAKVSLGTEAGVLGGRSSGSVGVAQCSLAVFRPLQSSWFVCRRNHYNFRPSSHSFCPLAALVPCLADGGF